MATKANTTETSVKKLKVNMRALDPNNVVPAGFLKNGKYRLDFDASSKFEERTSAKGKTYQVIPCEFTDAQSNTVKGNISEYQLPALMREGKIILGENMAIEVTRSEGSTFADINLINLGMPVLELEFIEK